MRRVVPVAGVLWLAGVLAGCGEPAPSPAETMVARGPHRGTLIRIPGDKGFVELVNEPEVTDRRDASPTSLVAYFFQPDGKTAMSPMPSDVVFNVAGGGGRGGRDRSASAKPIPMAAEPKTDDPAGAGRFASKPGPYLLSALRGTLDAKIEGQAVSTAVEGSR